MFGERVLLQNVSNRIFNFERVRCVLSSEILMLNGLGISVRVERRLVVAVVHGAAITVGIVDANASGIGECDEWLSFARCRNLELQLVFRRTSHTEVEIDGPRY